MAGQRLDEKSIFKVACSIESTEARNDYLRQVCGEEPELLHRVSRLLQIHAESPSFLESPADGVAATMQLQSPEHAGKRIGPYKLRELLGEGGMGSVYVAEQDKPFRRKVALKIIKPGMDSQEVIARFEAERQALALMEHPNIAKVFDAGTTELGRPYFIMELVKGLPITDHCDLHKLGNRDRLNLFLQVCHAVQHAHQKGIIHRDLKPSNVIVAMNDTIPVVKVIDFGVAKAIGQSLSDHSLYTNFNQMIGTPLYMSPEQAGQSSMDVDTRSDIYSLGVLLYEMITGSTPFAIETFKKVGYDEMRRIIREVEPPRPSARISTLNAEALSTISNKRQLEPQRLSKQLLGELDWIVMKAIEKQRDRRYNSASDFAADVQRYLNDEPVFACPPSYTYRIGKLARQYRRPLATAVVLVVTLLAATAISVRSAYVANAARLDSDVAREKTDEQRIRAENALAVADQNRRVADQRREETEKLKVEAIEQRDKTIRSLYVADMRLAEMDLRNENVSRLEKTLNSYVPKDSDRDFRDWEWYYLHSSCHHELSIFAAPASANVAWSKDGMKIGAIGKGEQAFIWNAADYSLRNSLQLSMHKLSGQAWGADWSPDSRLFASGLDKSDASVLIWDSIDHHTRTLLADPHDTIRKDVTCLAWSPDGKRLATGSIGGIRIWDAESGRPAHSIEKDCDNIWGIAWTPDSQLVAAAGQHRDGGVSVWNADSGETTFVHAEGIDFVKVAFSHEGAYMIAAHPNGVCDIVDMSTKQLLYQFKADDANVDCIASHPKAPIIATAGWGGAIHCWSLPDAKRIGSYFGHDKLVLSVAWSPEGDKFVSGSYDNTARVWPFTDLRAMRKWHRHSSDWVVEVSPLSTLHKPVELNESEAKLFEQFDSVERQSEIFIRCLEADRTDPDDEAMKRYIESAVTDTELCPKNLSRIQVSGNVEVGLVWSKDLSRLVAVKSINQSTTFQLWNTKTLEKTPLLTAENGFDLSWSPDSESVAIAYRVYHAGGGINTYSTRSGQLLKQFPNVFEAITAVTWNPSGSQIVSGNQRGVVFLWDHETEKLIAKTNIHQSKVTSIAFLPNGRRFATAADDGTVQITDAETMEAILSLNAGNSPISQLLWSSNGMQLAGKTTGGEIVVWDASNGYEYDHRSFHQKEMAEYESGKSESALPKGK